MLEEKGNLMAKLIPHTGLFMELEDSILAVLDVLEPLYGYLYSLNTLSRGQVVQPSGFFFLLANNWSKSSALDVVIDLYKSVTLLLLVFSEIEKKMEDFSNRSSLYSLLSTSKALKSKIPNVSSTILKIKDKQELISSKSACKTLFFYTESVRALIEELISLKKVILEESLTSYNISLTKEPLDLKGDLE
jgi:hypothetical protein